MLEPLTFIFFLSGTPASIVRFIFFINMNLAPTPVDPRLETFAKACDNTRKK